MESRRGTGIDRGVADGGDCGDVVNQTVVARIAVVYHPAETRFAELVVVAVEILPSHLIDNNAHDQLGTLVERSLCESRDGSEAEEKGEE